jgi:lysozyme
VGVLAIAFHTKCAAWITLRRKREIASEACHLLSSVDGRNAMRAPLSICLASALTGCMVGESGQLAQPDEDSAAGDGLAAKDDNPGDLAQIEARVCATGTTTLGIDVSYYQGTINWTSVKNAGIKFAFVRLSDGDTFQDPKFSANWTGAKQAGIVRGAYQFFRPSQNVTAQADKMIAAIGTYQKGDLPPVIDVEADGGLAPATVASKVRQWVDRVRNALGVDPIVYTGKYFWRDEVGSPASFANNPLWIAQYTSMCPDLPAPWQKWTFWQYTDSGSVAGISGKVDTNRFNGSVADLLAFAGGTSAPPPTNKCTSATLNRDVPEGTCVQAAADQTWYRCSGGSWVASQTGCTDSYAWCDSATLGRKVAPRTCVQAASDNTWYQCNGKGWVSPVDPIAESGPAGLCSASYQL